jgi:hypothetical protein
VLTMSRGCMDHLLRFIEVGAKGVDYKLSFTRYV